MTGWSASRVEAELLIGVIIALENHLGQCIGAVHFLLFHIPPVGTDLHFYQQRNRQHVGFFHLLANQ